MQATFTAKKAREYDIIKLHSLYLKHVQRKEEKRIQTEIAEKEKEKEKTTHHYLRSKLTVELKKLKKLKICAKLESLL